MTLTLLPLVAALALQGAEGPSAAPLVPRSAFFAPPARDQVRLAPDGSRVGWIEEGDGEPRLLVRDTSAGAEPTVVELLGSPVDWSWVQAQDEPASLVAVAVTSAGEGIVRAFLDEEREPEVLDTGSVTGMQLAALSRSRAAVAVRGTGTYLRVPLDGSEPTELPELGRFSRVWFDDELEPRAAITGAPRQGGIEAFARRGDRWERIASWGFLDDRTCGVLGVDAAGERLWRVDNTGRDRAALVELDLDTFEERVLAEDPDADLVPGGATFDPRTGAIEVVVAYWLGMRRHFLDEELEQTFRELAARVPGHVSYVDRDRDGRRWLVRSMDGGPLAYYVYDARERRLERLFGVVEELEGVPLATRTEGLVRTRDGLGIPCQVYLPPGADPDGDGRPDEPLPTVFYVHGGPWIGLEWNVWPTNRSFQLLASRGYAVVRVDFRGAGGYGRTWMDRGNREFGGKMTDDVVDATRWAVARGIADEERLALWGWSYGGYTVFQALAREPELFACGLSMYGLSDVDEFTRSLIARGAGESWRRRVGDPETEEGRATLRAHSPLFAAERIVAPLLVTHGALDAAAPISHSDRMVERLVELDRPVTYTVYPHEDHDYRAAESWISWWTIAERFLAEHAGGRAGPIGDDLEGARFEVRVGIERIEGLAEALEG